MWTRSAHPVGSAAWQQADGQAATSAAVAADGGELEGGGAERGEQRWVWRTPLERTQPFWDGWYRGLSEAFLGVPAPKVLMLAGTDRLDKPLMVGQMQGRFQLSLLPLVNSSITSLCHSLFHLRLIPVWVLQKALYCRCLLDQYWHVMLEGTAQASKSGWSA